MTSLQEICLLITDGKHGDCQNEIDSGFYFVSCKDIKDGWIDYTTARQITKSDYIDTHRRTQLEANDIVITNSGTIGRMAFIKNSSETLRTTFQKSVAIVKPNQEKVVPLWLYYSLMANRDALIAYAGGTAQKNLLLRDMRAFNLQVPSPAIQQKTVSILSAYDDLIENNSRRIHILEEMAQRIYTEWFVHFRFPGHEKVKMVDSDLGKIPSGWEIERFGKHYTIKNGFAFKSKDYSDRGTLIIRTKDFSTNKYIDINDEIRLPESLLSKYEGFLLQPLDFLLIMVGASIGRYGIVFQKDLPSLQNQNMWAIRPKPTSPLSRIYTIGAMPRIIDDVMSFATGAARAFFRKGFFYDKYISVPSNQTLEDFNNTVGPMVHFIANLLQKNQNLRQTRDLLLPKLISGEIDVSEMPDPREVVAAA